jgi:hypothetical protein
MGELRGMRNRLAPEPTVQGLKPLGYQGKNGAPEEIRTPDPQIRSLVLYPAELRARMP